MKRIIYKLYLALFAGSTILCGCSDSFLEPDPLSFYEPAQTFTTEEGLKSILAFCDRHIKLYYTSNDPDIVQPIGTEYIFSDLMVASATDKTKMLCDMANGLTPTSLDIGGDKRKFQNLDQTNSIWHHWHETYYVIMQANTIIKYVDGIESLDETTKNMYKGRAYFHRAFRYLNLVFQFGDVPLITKVVEEPKLNYRSTKRDAILKMITRDMELAVEWVPDQKEMDLIGMVNKAACRMLLAKCYLSVGEYGKAKEQMDILINQQEYALITGDRFGTFNEGGEPKTWPITRNVIWDLHRPENKLIPANTEVILGIPNRGSRSEAFVQMCTMRTLYPFHFDNKVQAKDGKQAVKDIKRTSGDYKIEMDYQRAMGRGVATFRPTYFYTHSLWAVNGEMDKTDLRHNSEVGNWIRMEDYKVNNKESAYYGTNLTLYDDNGKLLCSDTIRRWFDVPHYKYYLFDPLAEADVTGSNGYQGARDGGNADWYLYRLAEAYLLRAEAKFYMNPGDATIAEDLNIIRRRAKCTQFYQGGAVTIGDIMNERARELFWEEWRNVELTRVSLCLARSGRPDEWNNTYSLDNFDKQEGTDPNGGSYWYQRVTRYGMYNKGTITVNATLSTINYTMDKKNIYWPIFNASITANSRGQLAQNYGYDGYDPNTPKWETWEEAVADEDKTK